MSNLVELKPLPCPFCGAVDDVVIFSDEGQHQVLCWKCMCQTRNFNTKEECVAVWNRRTP